MGSERASERADRDSMVWDWRGSGQRTMSEGELQRSKNETRTTSGGVAHRQRRRSDRPRSANHPGLFEGELSD